MYYFTSQKFSFNNKLAIYIFLVSAAFLLISCDTVEPGDDSSGDPSPATPFFKYQFEGEEAVIVNCENINFEADKGNGHIEFVRAASKSTNAVFSYAFYGSSAAMDSLKPGSYPSGEIGIKVPMHLGLKVPFTKGGIDYYISLEPSSPDHKHVIEQIKKGGLENGKRIYFIKGSYKLPARNADNNFTSISGEYMFKLKTVEE